MVGEQLSISNPRHLVVDIKKLELHIFLPAMKTASCFYPYEPARVFLYSPTWPPSLSRSLNEATWDAAERMHKAGQSSLFELIAWVEEHSQPLEDAEKAKLRAKDAQLEVHHTPTYLHLF